ncbi:MAG: methyltransferase domain-containing protein [Acidithiobacillus sp.]
MDIKETDILGSTISTHWYYKSKASAALKLIGAIEHYVVLDVGAGSGFFSRYILRNSSASEAFCVDINYDSDTDSLEGDKPVHYRRAVAHVDADDVDLVLVMDVLEHVDDDTGLLIEYKNKVPSGTLFLISVPAFNFLWSDHDVFLEHKRRYTLNQLENVVRRSGLTVEKSSYYFGFVFPIAVASHLFGRLFRTNQQQPHSQLKRHSRLVNTLLYATCYAELPVIPNNRIAGITAFCLARVP